MQSSTSRLLQMLLQRFQSFYIPVSSLCSRAQIVHHQQQILTFNGCEFEHWLLFYFHNNSREIAAPLCGRPESKCCQALLFMLTLFISLSWCLWVFLLTHFLYRVNLILHQNHINTNTQDTCLNIDTTALHHFGNSLKIVDFHKINRKADIL